VSAACEIGQAVAVLNAWGGRGSQVTDAEAAKAFDKLFGAAARFFEKLPPPANSYAGVLKEISRASFFENMRVKLNPEERYKRQFQEIEGQ